MITASAWTAFVHWFDKDTLNLLSSLGSFAAALCAVVTVAMSRRQHLDALAGAPTIELPNHSPRVQLSFRDRLWDGMGDPSFTIHNIGSGAMLQAQVTARLRPEIGPRDPLPPDVVFSLGADAFAVRPDRRAVSRLHDGVEQAAIQLAADTVTEIFELAPNTTYRFRLPNDLQVWWLAHAALTGALIPGSPSAVLELDFATARPAQNADAVALRSLSSPWTSALSRWRRRPSSAPTSSSSLSAPTDGPGTARMA